MSGIFGCYDISKKATDVAKTVYYGIFSLQHRGQESAGICINNNGSFMSHKAMGMVTDVFDEFTLNALNGHSAIGTARLASETENGVDAMQPFSIKSRVGQVALSTNSKLLNANSIRNDLINQGAIFQTNTDAEVILSLFSRNRIKTDTTEEAVLETMKELSGAYALLFMTSEGIVGVRDPLGLRPLILGKKNDQYMLSSESCAFEAIGAEIIRDIDPGEIITISDSGLKSVYFNSCDGCACASKEGASCKNGKLCIFEFVYYARPDSVIDGASVYDSRVRVGELLAKECPCDCDIVIGAPDSGNPAAVGFARGSGVTYGAGLLKNRYVGRTFIQGTQEARELAVRMKFAVLKSAVKGKRICIVDDSLVRGTTTKHIIHFLRDAGASEVHLRIASPMVKYPCYYGVSTSSASELPARTMTVQEISDMIGADSLGYISLESLKASTEGLRMDSCTACFDGDFVAGVPEEN